MIITKLKGNIRSNVFFNKFVTDNSQCSRKRDTVDVRGGGA